MDSKNRLIKFIIMEKRKANRNIPEEFELRFIEALNRSFSAPEVLMLLQDYTSLTSPLLPSFKTLVRNHAINGEYAQGLKLADLEKYNVKLKFWKKNNKLS